MGIEKGKEFESIFFARRRYTGRGPPALASLHVRNNRPRYKMVKVIMGKRVSFRKATKRKLVSREARSEKKEMRVTIERPPSYPPKRGPNSV